MTVALYSGTSVSSTMVQELTLAANVEKRLLPRVGSNSISTSTAA